MDSKNKSPEKSFKQLQYEIQTELSEIGMMVVHLLDYHSEEKKMRKLKRDFWIPILVSVISSAITTLLARWLLLKR